MGEKRETVERKGGGRKGRERRKRAGGREGWWKGRGRRKRAGGRVVMVEREVERGKRKREKRRKRS